MGIGTESGYPQCVASEMGLKYEDTVVQMQRSDNNAFEGKLGRKPGFPSRWKLDYDHPKSAAAANR